MYHSVTSIYDALLLETRALLKTKQENKMIVLWLEKKERINKKEGNITISSRIEGSISLKRQSTGSTYRTLELLILNIFNMHYY